MDMYRLFFYLLLVLSITFTSCFTYVDMELNQNPKMVLHGYVSPQMDTTIVTLTNSAPLFTANPLKVRFIVHAIVEISDDNYHWEKMDFDTLFCVYFIPQARFPIYEGKTYHVRASATGFETVYSYCTVPYFRETYFKMDMGNPCNIKHEKWFDETHYHPKIEWTDYAGEDNYYTFMNSSFYLASWNYDWDEDGNIIYTDSLFKYGIGFFYNENWKTCIYSDHGKDGQRMNDKLHYRSNLYNMEKFVLYEVQTDKHWYMYHKSVYDSEGGMQFFMLEPAQFYTNIRNGYGVFGAFVMRKHSFEKEN